MRRRRSPTSRIGPVRSRDGLKMCYADGQIGVSMQRHLPISILFASFLVTGSFYCQASAGGDNIHEGEWEITSQMVMTGMPFQPKPVTRTQCITKKDAVPKPEREQGSCQISVNKADGGKVTWQVKCDKGDSNKAEGQG